MYWHFKNKREIEEACDRDKKALNEKILKHKEEILSLSADLESLRKEIEHGEKNEVVTLIKDMRTKRNMKIEEINGKHKEKKSNNSKED